MSKHKYIVGLHGCMGVAGHFARLLGFVVNQVVTLPHNETEAVGVLQDIGPKDIFIPFSFVRYYKTDMFLINAAKFHKARVCVVTDSPLVPIIPRPDIPLIAETPHVSFFNSAIGAEMIGEYIAALVCRKSSEGCRKRVRERDVFTTEFRVP